MNRPHSPTPGAQVSKGGGRFGRFDKVLLGALVVLIAAFSGVLLQLFEFASKSDLYSHILLIPFVSLYFVWIGRNESAPSLQPNRGLAVMAVAIAAAVMATSWYLTRGHTDLPIEDQLSGKILGFVLLVFGICAFRLGRATLFAISFPVAFLLFMVPFPTAVRDGIETFFQHTSSWAAAAFFSLARTPFFRDGTFFQLPGINLEVAPECSGIRSSLALFITSIVAGRLFLKSRSKRALLALAVIPLGIIRNGLRVFTIGELCVHVGPEMIDSPIHHRGGPLFFALSLIPFGILLFLLTKSDRRKLTHGSHDNSAPKPFAPAVEPLPRG